jgi:predicted flavoprotein YhiN
LKEFPLHGESLVGFDKAIITAGGVDLKEVNSKTMQSRLVSNLYFAGEILDLDGPTGGYNLQVTWSTGWTVGGV